MVERKVMRNGACMTGFFSSLGPTKGEICHAHARTKDCTGFHRKAAEFDSCGTPPIVVRIGHRGDGRRVPSFQCQLLIWTSPGLGAPLPVSTSAFRLIRKIAHFVLQWCMNSTGSFQSRCLKSTIE